MGAFLSGMTLTRLLWESRSAGSSAGRDVRSEDVLVMPGAAESKDLAEQRGSGTAPTSEAADVRLGDNLCSMVPASPRVLVPKDPISVPPGAGLLLKTEATESVLDNDWTFLKLVREESTGRPNVSIESPILPAIAACPIIRTSIFVNTC